MTNPLRAARQRPTRGSRPHRPDRAGRRPTVRRALALGVASLLGFLLLGNGIILGASAWAGWRAPTQAPVVSSISHLEAVDDHLWRGAAPGAKGLAELAANGVTTIVDLRAEAGVDEDAPVAAELGLDRYRLPVRDGQLPTAEQAARFLEIVDEAEGTVFVHCGAGVGRTGAVVAHYLTSVDGLSGRQALRRNLAVGPPSLEQIVFAATADGGSYERPGAIVTGLSRVLDAPRRIWHNLT